MQDLGDMNVFLRGQVLPYYVLANAAVSDRIVALSLKELVSKFAKRSSTGNVYLTVCISLPTRR